MPCANHPAEYDLQSPVEADRTTCRDPAGPGPQTSPRGPGSRTAGLPGTNGVESPGDQARAWSQCREVLFQKGFLKASCQVVQTTTASVISRCEIQFKAFQTLLDHLSTHSHQLLGRREPGTGQLAPGRGTAGHPKMLQRIYRFNEFLTKASFPRPPAPPPTHTGAQYTLQYTYKPADPAVTPGQACRAHASRPRSRAHVSQRRASPLVSAAAR